MTRTDDHRWLCWVVIASQFGPPFMFSGVAVALPDLAADLGAGATSLGLVETLFLAGSVAFMLPIGRLADASDKNTLYKLGLLGFAASSLLIGVLSSLPAILALRFLQGVAAAVFAVTGPAILADVVPPERRGRAFGSSLGAIYAGLTLGPLAAGWLVEHWGWRAVFLGGGALILVLHQLVRWRLHSAWRRPDAKAAHVPSVLLVAAATLCVVGAGALLRQPAIAATLLALGLWLGAVFVRLQGRLDRPLVDLAALRQNASLRRALLVQLLLYTDAYCSIFLLSIFLQVALGQDAETAGHVIALGTVVMAVAAPLAGALADRVRPQLVAGLGVALVLASALLALTFDRQTPLWCVAAMLAAQSLGFALFSSPNMAVIMNSVPAALASTASALGAKARSLGMVSGMLATGALISLRIGDDPVAAHPDEFTSAMTNAYALLAVLAAAALGTCWLARAGPAPPAPPAPPRG
jgi:MFS family permease